MGTKVSTMAAKKKKRIASSLQSTKSKTYNMDSSSTIPSNCHTIEEKHDIEHISNVSSITESMLNSGRTFHHVQNSAYWFPNDDQEMDRLIGVSKFKTLQLIFFNVFFIYLFITIATLCIKNLFWRVNNFIIAGFFLFVVLTFKIK